jgi:hypothetical protein
MMDRVKEGAVALKDALVAFVKREPVILMYAILAAVNVGGYFGFDASAEMLAGIDAIFVPALAYLTRRKVTPLAELEPMSVGKFIELYGEGEEA